MFGGGGQALVRKWGWVAGGGDRPNFCQLGGPRSPPRKKNPVLCIYMPSYSNEHPSCQIVGWVPFIHSWVACSLISLWASAWNVLKVSTVRILFPNLSKLFCNFLSCLNSVNLHLLLLMKWNKSNECTLNWMLVQMCQYSYVLASDIIFFLYSKWQYQALLM